MHEIRYNVHSYQCRPVLGRNPPSQSAGHGVCAHLFSVTDPTNLPRSRPRCRIFALGGEALFTLTIRRPDLAEVHYRTCMTLFEVRTRDIEVRLTHVSAKLRKLMALL